MTTTLFPPAPVSTATPTPAPTPNRRRSWPWIVGGSAAVLIAIGAAAGAGSNEPASETKTPATVAAATVSTPSTDDGEITMDEFHQIQSGMSHDQVTSIVGGAGELSSSTDLVGINTEMRTWDGPSPGANANVMFQNGVVISKAQAGL